MSDVYVTPGHPVKAGAGYDCNCGQCLAARRGGAVMTDKLTFPQYVSIVVHRVLAQHAPHTFCDECPLVRCQHCGTWSKPGDDHTCPCPNRDDECLDHPGGAMQ